VEAYCLSKVTVKETDSFTMYLEVYNNMLFIHCDVYKWGKGVYKELKVCLKGLLKKYKQPIYAAQTDGDNKQRKFLDMYGFKYFGIVEDSYGKNREIFVKGSKL
jgi:hypothetical protein